MNRDNSFAITVFYSQNITSAYWRTSSTSFANPAVTIARSLTDTFSGILWTGAAGFIAAQLVGAAFAYGISRLFSE
jgi:glycerol uptake facilitator-like aquaporin